MNDITSFLPQNFTGQDLQQKRTDAKLERFSKADPAKLSQEEIRKLAQDFEAFFLSQVLEYMTQDLETGGMFGGGHAEGIYRSMMNEEYGKSIAARGGMGIGDILFADMMKLQQQRFTEDKVLPESANVAYLTQERQKQKHPSLDTQLRARMLEDSEFSERSEEL